MRISDWSSDVCSSDLVEFLVLVAGHAVELEQPVFEALAVHQCEQSAHLVQREAELATAADEGQPFDVPGIVNALAARAARGLGHDADPLVVADRLDVDTRATRQISDAVRLRSYVFDITPHFRSEEHTSELQSLMRISYAVFCLKKKT